MDPRDVRHGVKLVSIAVGAGLAIWSLASFGSGLSGVGGQSQTIGNGPLGGLVHAGVARTCAEREAAGVTGQVTLSGVSGVAPDSPIGHLVGNALRCGNAGG